MGALVVNGAHGGEPFWIVRSAFALQLDVVQIEPHGIRTSIDDATVAIATQHGTSSRGWNRLRDVRCGVRRICEIQCLAIARRGFEHRLAHVHLVAATSLGDALALGTVL